MANITGLTLGGTEWEPQFVTAIDPKKCIGCGRCFKVCPRDVLDLVVRGEEVELDDEDYDEDDTASVMSVKNAKDCIGCGACGRVCPKECYSYAASPVQA
ncbi:ferredoxin III, nif-specific [Propionivibrio limicola]|uniref:ferredoxin III, nif-specific n=1 Tax=Propionivibrio limicola TaxID=167645 RepID=UPI0012912DB6|nr:ferredoxin III, nif-specific [Propionivibrio limicola]